MRTITNYEEMSTEKLKREAETTFDNAEDESDYKKALEMYTELIRREPTVSIYYFYCGCCFKQIDDLNKAIDAFGRAIELESDEPYYYEKRGNTLLATGKIPEAIDDFNKAVELGGTTREYENRAKALTKAGRYEEAVDDYTNAIVSINGYYSECYEQRGWLNMKLGRYNAAMADFAEAIRENPAEPVSYCNYGKMLYDLGRFDEAIVCFTKAIEFASDSDMDLVVVYLKNRGNAYRELGQFENAYADYARGFEITPENSHLYFLRGFAKAAEGDFEAAYADTLKAIQLKPDESGYYDALGNVFRKFERYEDAVNYYTVAIDMDSECCEFYKNRAEAYTALGKIKEAKSDNAKAAKLEKANRHADSDDTDFDPTAEFEKPGRLMSYEEIANEILRRIKLKTLRKTAIMKLKRQETTLINSKFGGLPFIPVGGEYPKNPESGEGLHFILQINFAEMPPLPDYPTEGILQLFIADGDDLWEWAGVKDEEFNRQNKWRMLYYEDISNPMPENEVKSLMPAPPKCMDYTPIFREYGKDYLIEFEARDLPITYNDFRCRDTIVKYGADMIPEYNNELKKRSSDFWDYTCVKVMVNSLDNRDNRVGGYPFNQQGDPRGQRGVPENYELLLQIEYAEDENEQYIFCISGPATFFIDPEDLKKRDFSKVYFYIDFD